jgi:hypothetical protein
MSDNTSRQFASGRTGVLGGSFTSWRMTAIARDRRQVWHGWLGWNAPILTQRVWSVWSQHPLQRPQSLTSS